jgi:hypothetical protein
MWRERKIIEKEDKKKIEDQENSEELDNKGKKSFLSDQKFESRRENNVESRTLENVLREKSSMEKERKNV